MKITVNGRDLSSYCIVLPKDADFDLRQSAWRLQSLAKACGATLSVGTKAVCRKTPIRLIIDQALADNAYRVTIDEKGALTIAGGHYTGVVCALDRMEAQAKACDCYDITPFAGETDLPLTWCASPDATGKTTDKHGREWHLKNSEILPPSAFGTTYRLVWNDEFNGTRLDLEKWSGCPNMRMPDVDLSLDEPVVAVRDGSLVMTSEYLPERNPERPYTSNYSIVTHDTMNFSGGYLEMRAKVPCKGLGEWPSFWLISGDSVLFKERYAAAHDGKVFEPYRIEVDIFEQFSIPVNRFIPNLHKHFSSAYQPREDYEQRNVETGEWEPLTGGRQISGVDQGSAVSGTPAYIFPDFETANGWHTYGFLWTDDLMAFSVDGVFYYSYSMTDTSDPKFNPRVRNKKTGKEFVIDMEGYKKEHAALSILLNNMLFTPGYAASNGGRWIRNWRELKVEDHDRLFPLVYEVDYMRLYQCDKDFLYTPETIGRGIADFNGADPRWYPIAHGPASTNEDLL